MEVYFVDAVSIDNKNFKFLKQHIVFESSPNFISLENWIATKESSDNNMILQMDIEGVEYDILLDTSRETLS